MLLEIQDAAAKAGQVVREAVGGLQTVRSFGAEEHEVCRYKEALEQCRKLWWRRDLERALYLLLRRVRKLNGWWEGPERDGESPGKPRAGLGVPAAQSGGGREEGEWE